MALTVYTSKDKLWREHVNPLRGLTLDRIVQLVTGRVEGMRLLTRRARRSWSWGNAQRPTLKWRHGRCLLTVEMKRYEHEIGPTGQVNYSTPSGYHNDYVVMRFDLIRASALSYYRPVYFPDFLVSGHVLSLSPRREEVPLATRGLSPKCQMDLEVETVI